MRCYRREYRVWRLDAPDLLALTSLLLAPLDRALVPLVECLLLLATRVQRRAGVHVVDEIGVEALAVDRFELPTIYASRLPPADEVAHRLLDALRAHARQVEVARLARPGHDSDGWTSKLSAIALSIRERRVIET